MFRLNVNGPVENLGSVHFEDRPLSSGWTLHFGSQPFSRLASESKSTFASFPVGFRAKIDLKNDGNLLSFVT